MFHVFLVCPQRGATTVTQMESVPRPNGIAQLRCDFKVPSNPIHHNTGFLYLTWYIHTVSEIYRHSYDPYNVVSKTSCFPSVRKSH